MKILVVGSGGREHAICHAFSKSSRVNKIYCANGNAGIASAAECVQIAPDEIKKLRDFALSNAIDLTFVGGETSLALGIVDEFEKHDLKIIGASRAAARLESSKAFSKDFMARHDVPTAVYRNADSADEAIAILNENTFGGEDSPVVVKADGLAAGKGVIVATDRAQAIDAIGDLKTIAGADAASRIVLESFLPGREVSLIMFVDGEDFAVMPPTRDHKRIGEGDTGPNTGGMGTITDDTLLSAAQREHVIDKIIMPTLSGCIAEGFPFRGILFLGLMIDDTRLAGGDTVSVPSAVADGDLGTINLLEYNVRFGDPETQSILVRLETDIVEICEAMLEGKLGEKTITWRGGNSATVVLAAKGYPYNPRKGDVIEGIADASETAGVTIFHSGTATDPHDSIITSGGRVLGITATGETLPDALSKSYAAVGKITFDGMQYRRDIGK